MSIIEVAEVSEGARTGAMFGRAIAAQRRYNLAVVDERNPSPGTRTAFRFRQRGHSCLWRAEQNMSRARSVRRTQPTRFVASFPTYYTVEKTGEKALKLVGGVLLHTSAFL